MKRSCQRGFTLIELLLSVSILMIILGAVTGALVTFLSNGRYTSERDDHSGGAMLLSTYLNRDMSSADSRTSTSCAPSGTTVLTLGWAEWTATPDAPRPAPGPRWRSSYVVTDDQAAPGGAARYALSRWLCAPDGTAAQSTLVRNLAAVGAGGPASVVTVTPTADADCPGGVLRVSLPSYLEDAAAGSYEFTGCLGGRAR